VVHAIISFVFDPFLRVTVGQTSKVSPINFQRKKEKQHLDWPVMQPR
jgi:hypothetical protein